MNLDNMKTDVISKINNYFIKKNIQFNGVSFEDYICEWLDTCDKRISSKKRNVFYSKELQEKINNNQIDDETKRLINAFKLKFENGEDICPYLSKNIKDATSIDCLLTFWRIHHLHLIEEMESDMSKRSDKYILFIVFRDNVYFLDQTKHLSGKEFASRFLLEILCNNNWLHLVSIYKTPETKSVNYEITSDEEMYELWKSNINYCVFKIGDSFYTNINGKTAAGTSLQNQLCICDMKKAMYRASQSDKMIYSRTEIDEKLLRLTIYCCTNGLEHEWITIEGE